MNTRIHAKYFSRFLNLLPPRLSCHDSTRCSLAFFSVSGMDVLDELNLLSDDAKQNIINWVYSLQVIPKGDVKCGGFQVCWCRLLSSLSRSLICADWLKGATTLNILDVGDNCPAESYKWGHLAMTYTSIAILVILGDDLTRLDRNAIIEGRLFALSPLSLWVILSLSGVAAVQRPDGSFSASVEGNEYDMRFVYCACCICFMLNDWGRVNKSSMARYILDSIVSLRSLFTERKLQPCFYSATTEASVNTSRWNHTVEQHSVLLRHLT